jgi:hypothetical protein
MKIKYLLTLVIVLFLGTFANAQKKSEITSAEQMVVYNKSHNNDQYKGLIVIYNYEIVNSNAFKSEELKRFAETRFTNVMKASLSKHGTKEILSITTEGNTDNNSVYYDILKSHPNILVQNKRELLLK